MKINIKKRLALLTVGLATVSSLTAFAGEVVEGGTWDHGVSSTVWSQYLHNSKEHGSSAMNGDGNMDKDYNVRPGRASYASVKATKHGNKAYYCIGHRY